MKRVMQRASMAIGDLENRRCLGEGFCGNKVSVDPRVYEPMTAKAQTQIRLLGSLT
jgi:hypothetical protein